MKENSSGRGSGFTRAENEYIVAKCLLAIAGKDKVRDIDIAEKLNRGKNNIAIRRRALGFSYKQDNETGEIKVIYERPKNRDFYVNIEKLDVNRAIATIEYRIAKKKMIVEGIDDSDLKVSDFYPDKSFENFTEEKLLTIAKNIIGDEDNNNNSENINKKTFEMDYENEEESLYENKTSDRFIDKENNDNNKAEDDYIIVENTNDSCKNKDEDSNEDDIFYEDNDIKNETYDKEESEEDERLFSSMTFLMTKESLDTTEWLFFKEKWKEYMETYGGQFDEVSDWDDLNGYILEQIKKLRLLKKEKSLDDDYSKELSLCTARANEYKKNLATSRMSRIQQKVDTRLNLADIIKLFEDNEKYIELNYQAELELKGIAEYIREGLIVPENLADFSKIDGNEPALLVGVEKSYEYISKLISGEEESNES